MCGILAVLCEEIPNNLQVILDSGKYLNCRGPDFYNAVIDPGLGGLFLFHRLSINDTSSLGNQPMRSGKIIMMANAEIYNHKDLEEEFNIICKSKSDCEIILILYEKIGFIETIKRLYGVFAIVLTDGNKTYLARDRIGVRPLYFGITEENYLAVSSVPNSLVNFCKGITALPPGTIFSHESGTTSKGILKLLWKDEISLPKIRLPVEGIPALHDSLVNSVKLRLMSDRPMGCLLSGGLDSSIITAILCKFLGPKNVRTYSVGMEGSTDLYYARKVADYLGTDHHEVLFTPEEGFDIIPEVIKILASYDITTIRASVGMYIISKYIQNHGRDKVIFSGEGSDEILEGYLYFHNAPSPEEAENETIRLIRQLHLYDVLRADRCISSCGLEPRVPFLDRNVVDTVLSIPCLEKAPKNGIEKYILRKAFESYLPPEIAWRRKEAFSDGVSSIKKSWYSYIQERVEKIIPNNLFNPNFPSKEAMYYKMIFDNLFPTYNLKMDYWMPRWTDAKDPSARTLKEYTVK